MRQLGIVNCDGGKPNTGEPTAVVVRSLDQPGPAPNQNEGPWLRLVRRYGWCGNTHGCQTLSDIVVRELPSKTRTLRMCRETTTNRPRVKQQPATRHHNVFSARRGARPCVLAPDGLGGPAIGAQCRCDPETSHFYRKDDVSPQTRRNAGVQPSRDPGTTIPETLNLILCRAPQEILMFSGRRSVT